MRRVAAGTTVICAYAALVVWFTWPLADRATTHFPLTMLSAVVDTPLATWAAAHETRTLFAGAAALADAGIYHPTPNSLYYAEAGFGALPLFAPVFLATGNPTLAMNVVFLAGVTLTASAVHLVTRYWAGSHLAGFVAGLTFLTTPWVLWTWMPTAPNYAVVFYLPFVMLLAAAPHTTWRRSLALGLLILVQGLSSPYVAFATCAPLSVLAAYRVVRSETRRAGLQLLAILATASALSVPVYWGYVLVQRENPHLSAQSVHSIVDVLPSRLPDDLFASIHPTALPAIAWALIVLGILCRALPATATDRARRRAGWRHAGFWAVVGVILSIKSHVTVAGVPWTLPHVVLAPVFKALRVQQRIGVTALIACSVLAGIAFAEITARLPVRSATLGRVATAAVLVGLFLASYAQPIQVQAMTLDPRAAYPTKAAPVADATVDDAVAEGSGALLELPVNPHWVLHTDAMYRAIRHRRPLLNGYSGYYPADFPARMELACRLPDPDALAALVRTTDIGMILVHVNQLNPRRSPGLPPYRCPPFPGRPGAEPRAWLRAKNSGVRRDMELVATGKNDALLFRVVR